jgi:hypothetical protein
VKEVRTTELAAEGVREPWTLHICAGVCARTLTWLWGRSEWRDALRSKVHCDHETIVKRCHSHLGGYLGLAANLPPRTKQKHRNAATKLTNSVPRQDHDNYSHLGEDEETHFPGAKRLSDHARSSHRLVALVMFRHTSLVIYICWIISRLKKHLTGGITIAVEPLGTVSLLS